MRCLRCRGRDSSLRERARPPGQLAAGERELLVHHMAERGDDAGRAVTPLHPDLIRPRALPGRPIGERAVAERMPLEHGVDLDRAPIRQRRRL